MSQHPQDIDSEIISHLKVLGLSDAQANKAVRDRSGFIDSCIVNEELSNKEIAGLIWSELVNPFNL